MVINMLEAVSEMLRQESNDKTQDFIVRAACAKIMLDKVIEGMKPKSFLTEEDVAMMSKYEEDIRKDTHPDKNPVPMPKPKPKTKSESPHNPGEYRIVVDDQQRIKEITNLPLEALVELDGVAMTHLQAIGKTFTSGRVI